ncbi:MAG: 1-acyl-sn-glycerol-3-phosphate acyltransferase [Firmicutes bacterium]|nr:1-acyl-sn-glycerol-3-phosphate acyltransferase [Bacillota bacterium]
MNLKIIKSIPFGIWFFAYLPKIQPYRNRAVAYHEAEKYEEEIEELRKVIHIWGSAVTKKAGIKVKVQGLENIPEGPVVFVSNHQGNFDIPIFFTAIPTHQHAFVAKASLLKIPIFGKWIRDIRSVFIERDDARASLKAIQEGVDMLKKGFSLAIFPEGTRARSSNMAEFKKGSLRLATKAGVPVVPVTLNGSYRGFEEKGYVRPCEVDFYIHPAIETASLSKLEANDLAATVETIIRTKLEEMCAKEKQ